MIRTTTMTILAVGLFTLTGLSAMAATQATHHHGKAAMVAQAGSTVPAAAAKPQKKVAKKASVTKPGKDKTDGTPAGTPAPEKMPEKN